MAHNPRTTRDQILRQVELALRYIPRMQACFQRMDEIAAGRHDAVTLYTPMLVRTLDAYAELLRDFRSKL